MFYIRAKYSSVTVHNHTEVKREVKVKTDGGWNMGSESVILTSRRL